ncbi:MAG TPA: thioredoxin domain-containing protein, partial [Actinomycetota bacterium]|nr:thioredoxin domain-containing protein [Actinomycetota bacterium]
QWLVPHFEKMLYDNAQLLRTYARSWVMTNDARHREVAEMTAHWLLTEMRDPAGGFWSSLDADSEGIEGRFYVWAWDEAVEVLGGQAAAETWGMSREGNFEGANIPIYRADAEPSARETTRRALLERRATRIRPGTDDKVLTSWNGLTAAALAEAGSILDRPAWIDAAVDTMEFLLRVMRPNGRLLRAFRDGRVNHLGVAEDYAYALEGCLSLHQATLDLRWVEVATELANEAITLFEDDDGGGFFMTGTDAEKLVTRTKDLVDNAVPSSNSVFANELQRLAAITGDTRYEEPAIKAMRLVAPAARRSPLGFGCLLSAVHRYVADPREIAVAGEPGAPDTEAMVAAVRPLFPSADVLVVGPADGTSSWPLLRDRAVVGGRAAAYVCRRGVCDLPVTSLDEAKRALASR